MNKLVEVKVTYFKSSGKYYTEGSFYVSEYSKYWDIVDMVRYWRSFPLNRQQPMPGLSVDRWDGYAVVVPQSENLMFPTLIDWTKDESTNL